MQKEIKSKAHDVQVCMVNFVHFRFLIFPLLSQYYYCYRQRPSPVQPTAVLPGLKTPNPLAQGRFCSKPSPAARATPSNLHKKTKHIKKRKRQQRARRTFRLGRGGGAQIKAIVLEEEESNDNSSASANTFQPLCTLR